ncbi:MAG: GNAT superfamily N-acetyltransferase [Saprospiraceae bacterium]|jgi:GNAT superfamily N-acetyltransferase
MSFEIKQGNIKTVVALSREIDEFHDPHDELEYSKRLHDVPHIILIGWAEGQAIGFKVGYEREGFFYSWMGGVLRSWRQKGVAKALAEKQETWARQQGYSSVTLKTRNRLKAMLLFSIRNGFHIIGFEEKSDVSENRILLRKEL